MMTGPCELEMEEGNAVKIFKLVPGSSILRRFGNHFKLVNKICFFHADRGKLSGSVIVRKNKEELKL